MASEAYFKTFKAAEGLRAKIVSPGRVSEAVGRASGFKTGL